MSFNPFDNWGLFSGGDNNSGYQLPDFQVDPYYTKEQGTLDQWGTNALNGKLPDAYQNLLQFNSPQFQAMMQSVQGNIQKGVLESAAQNGTAKSGLLPAATSDALGQVLPQMGYADYLNTQNNEKGVMQMGLSTLDTVDKNAMNQEGMVNSYGLQKSLDQYKINNDIAGQQGQMFGSLMQGGLGALSGFAMSGGNPLGAIAGGLGGMTGQSSSMDNFFSMLNSSKQNTPNNQSYGGMTDNGISSSFGGFGLSGSSLQDMLTQLLHSQ